MMRTTQSAPGSNAAPELPRPGVVGRSIRLALGVGVGVVVFLVGLLTGWRDNLRAGIPPFDLGFGTLVGLVLYSTSYVFNIALGLSWGQRTLAGVVGGAVVAGLVGYAVEGALLRGGDVSSIACPGGIDRLDHIGSH